MQASSLPSRCVPLRTNTVPCTLSLGSSLSEKDTVPHPNTHVGTHHVSNYNPNYKSPDNKLICVTKKASWIDAGIWSDYLPQTSFIV